MTILPAIDLKDGKCVRLRQGRADDVTVYGDDPARQARDWAEQGARELHVVDLDGAFDGAPRHADVIRRINIWGVCDSDSWKNNWPIPGRHDSPLWVDRDYELKPFLKAYLND